MRNIGGKKRQFHPQTKLQIIGGLPFNNHVLYVTDTVLFAKSSCEKIKYQREQRERLMFKLSDTDGY